MRLEDLIEELENVMQEVGPDATVHLTVSASREAYSCSADLETIDYNIDRQTVYLEGEES